MTVSASPASHSPAAATGTRGYLLGAFFAGRVGFGVGVVACSASSPVPTKKVLIYGAPPKHPRSQLCHRWAVADLQRQPPPHPIHSRLPSFTKARRQVLGGPVWAFPLASSLNVAGVEFFHQHQLCDLRTLSASASSSTQREEALLIVMTQRCLELLPSGFPPLPPPDQGPLR